MYSFANHSLSTEHTNEESNWYADQPQGVSVHTGFPNPGIDATIRGIDLNSLLIQHSAGTYLMRVAGNEWRHCGVFDGDIVIVDRVIDSTPSDIVVWWHEGDFAISERPRMRPDGMIWGVVTAIIHPCRGRKESR